MIERGIAACVLVVALAVASGARAEGVPPGPAERARASVALALADSLDAAGTQALVAAFEDPDESVRLAAAMAACHSTAVTQSVFTYALGTVHTAIRPALRKKPAEQVWDLTPDAAALAIKTYLPGDLPQAKLARLLAAAVDANGLTRDAAQFILSRDALVSQNLAGSVDAIVFDVKVNGIYRIELAAMCIERLHHQLVPLIVEVGEKGGDAQAACVAMMDLMVRSGLGKSVAEIAARPDGRLPISAARVLLGHVRADTEAREGLKQAYRADTLQQAVRELIDAETTRLKQH